MRKLEQYDKQRKKAKNDFINEVRDIFIEYGSPKAKEIINESDLPTAVKQELCDVIDNAKEAYDLYGAAKK